MNRLTFQVTQEDINLGTQHQGDCCPVALALKRITGCIKLHVRRETFKLGPFAAVVKNTKAMTKFIEDFDNGVPVKPHTFTVNL